MERILVELARRGKSAAIGITNPKEKTALIFYHGGTFAISLDCHNTYLLDILGGKFTGCEMLKDEVYGLIEELGYSEATLRLVEKYHMFYGGNNVEETNVVSVSRAG